MGDASSEWTKFGRYALLEKIGSGGMAEIYRAKTFGAAGFEKEYAIKLIIPSLVDDTEFVEMFINEAKIVVNLYHANIVQVFDLGEIDGQYYIAMEYVHGKDLLDILARCAELNLKIPLNLVLFVTMEMLKGLNFAHTAKDPYGEDLNIIHRDVSPSNIMLSYAGDVKVGDFGVAKAAAQRSLTDSDTLKGKVGYMSPEQVMGEEIDCRSDIFSAGIVFFEALSMSRLFVGDSDLDVMLKVGDAEIDEAIDRMKALPSGLERIVRKALAKDPDDRYQTATEFYQALVDFCYQHSIKVTGNDLSNLMRRLFEEEIEEEKSKRRVENDATPSKILEEESTGLADGSRTSEAGIISTSNASEVGDQDTDRDDVDPNTGPVGEVGVRDTENDDGSSGADNEVSTLDEKDAQYQFKSVDGDAYGPFSREELIDLVQNRISHPEDRISIDGGEWKPVAEFDLLAEHVPEYTDSREETQRKKMPPGARQPERTEGIDSDEQSAAGDLGQKETSLGGTQNPDEESRADAARGDESTSNTSGDEPEDSENDADESLESSVRAMEELSAAFTEESTQDDAPLDDDKTATEDAASFERTPTPSSVDEESLQALETAPEDDDVDSITELKDQYASYEGSLVETPFPRLMARLHIGTSTGRLHVQRGEVEKSIYVREGEPVFVDSSKKDELFGSFLLSRGIIDQEQLDKALARLHEWGGRLGDALVAIGAVPAHDIYELLSEQMREKILDVFTWREGYYGYYENQEPETKGYPLGIDALKIIVEGCREHVPFGHLVDYYDERMEITIREAESMPFDIDRLGLTTRELRVLNRISPKTTLSRLLDTFPSTQKSQVYRIVYLLQQLEVVDFKDSDDNPLPDV